MSQTSITLRYFAWMREHTGADAETIDLPDGVTSVGDLLPLLRDRSAGHALSLIHI